MKNEKKLYYFFIKLWPPAEFSPVPCSTRWLHMLIAKWCAPCTLKFLICWVYLSWVFCCGPEKHQRGVVKWSNTHLHLPIKIKWLCHEANDSWQYYGCSSYRDAVIFTEEKYFLLWLVFICFVKLTLFFHVVRFIAAPFLSYLGLEDKPSSFVPNTFCEKVFQTISKSPNEERVEGLSKQLGWSTYEVRRWFKNRRQQSKPSLMKKATESRLEIHFLSAPSWCLKSGNLSNHVNVKKITNSHTYW